jgi:hypothetical protein
MPLNERFYNPGAAATGALFDFLADREVKQRQALVDQAAQDQQAWENQFRTQQQDQAAQTAQANMRLQQEQAASLREQREAAAALNAQKRALGVIGMMQPGAAVDADTAGIVREGGFGSLLQTPGVVAGMPREADAAVADEVDSALLASDPNALRTDPTFRGTPQQMALQQFLADPSVPTSVRQYLAARSAAGDENIPYQLFQQDGGTDVNWQRFEGVRPGSSSPEFFRQHPRTGQIQDMQGNVVMDVQPAPTVSGPEMTAESINMGASYLLQTGKMPPGISARDIETQRRIRNRAAEMDPTRSLSTAELNRRADERFVASVNSPAANQLAMAIDAADDHLTQLETALKAWEPGGVRAWNSARFKAALEGALGPDQQIAASQVDQVFTDFIAAIARVYTGGQAITNDMLALASRNIDRDWSGPAIEKAIETQRETLANRRERFAGLTSRGTEGRTAPSGSAPAS